MSSPWLITPQLRPLTCVVGTSLSVASHASCLQARSVPGWLLIGMSDSLRISSRSKQELPHAIDHLKKKIDAVFKGEGPLPKSLTLQPEVAYALGQMGLSSSSHRFRDQQLLAVKDIKACTGPQLAQATGLPLGSANEVLRRLDELVKEYYGLDSKREGAMSSHVGRSTSTKAPQGGVASVPGGAARPRDNDTPMGFGDFDFEEGEDVE